MILEDRVERLRTLVARFSGQPGGAYPVFRLAMANVDDDERAAMRAVIAESAFAEPFAVWSDPASSPGQRALALAKFEPKLAHVHALLADLRLRDDDAHNEPEPELHRTIERVQPKLAVAYRGCVARFIEEFDSCSEIDATRRGFCYYVGEIAPLLEGHDELVCFERGGGTAFRLDLPASETAEAHLRHDREGASAQMKTATFLALECPELLVSLHLYDDARAALPEADVANLERALPNKRTFYCHPVGR